MARKTTLGQLINDVRAEAGHSLAPNLGASMRDVIINVLQRQQRMLWEGYDWPFLRVVRHVPVQAGSRYYDFPEELSIERVESVEFKWGNQWTPVEYGIETCHLDVSDSDAGVRSWPIERWDEADGDQLEVWPIPTNDGTTDGAKDGCLRFTGIRKLSRLTEESDRADLDDTLLVLFSAAEILAREKANDAGLKLQRAERHLSTLKARNAKSGGFSMIGGHEVRRPRGPKIIAVRNV